MRCMHQYRVNRYVCSKRLKESVLIDGSPMKSGRLIMYLNRVFTTSMPTCCSNTRLKSVAKRCDSLTMNAWSKSFCIGYKDFQFGIMSASLACVSDSVPILHSTYDHQLVYPFGTFATICISESSFSTCSFRKMYFSVQIIAISKT